MCFYLFFTAINAANDARDRMDYRASNLYLASSILYFIAGCAFLVGLIPGMQIATIIGAIAMLIATILDVVA